MHNIIFFYLSIYVFIFLKSHFKCESSFTPEVEAALRTAEHSPLPFGAFVNWGVVKTRASNHRFSVWSIVVRPPQAIHVRLDKVTLSGKKTKPKWYIFQNKSSYMLNNKIARLINANIFVSVIS